MVASASFRVRVSANEYACVHVTVSDCMSLLVLGLDAEVAVDILQSKQLAAQGLI